MCTAADLSDCHLVGSRTPAGMDVKGDGKAAVHRSAAHSGAQTLDVRPPAVLFGHAPGKVDGQLRVDHAPVLPPSRPLFRDVHHRQIQHFQQAVVCGKHRFGLGHLAQLAVEALYGVGGVGAAVFFCPHTYPCAACCKVTIHLSSCLAQPCQRTSASLNRSSEPVLPIPRWLLLQKYMTEHVCLRIFLYLNLRCVIPFVHRNI